MEVSSSICIRWASGVAVSASGAQMIAVATSMAIAPLPLAVWALTSSIIALRRRFAPRRRTPDRIWRWV